MDGLKDVIIDADDLLVIELFGMRALEDVSKTFGCKSATRATVSARAGRPVLLTPSPEEDQSLYYAAMEEARKLQRLSRGLPGKRNRK